METFTLHVVGEAEGPFSGSRPENIDQLISKPDKDTASLLYQIAKTQIELCCQKGDTEGALIALQKYQEKEFSYAAPLNVFPKDNQNGAYPYIGAHCVFGAIRDAMRLAFDDEIKFYRKKGDDAPSKKHLRDFVFVKPHHIFMYRPALDGTVISKVDEEQGQQPCGDVKGFSRYEVIHPPFQFQFNVNVVPKGPFKTLNPKLMKEVISQAVNHGLGSRRAAGYGMWKIVSIA